MVENYHCMQKMLLWVLLTTGCHVTGWTQKNKMLIKGQLVDTLQKQKIENATISVITITDSSLVGFTRSDVEGNFVLDNLKLGQYRLSVSHVNFHPLRSEERRVGKECRS